VITTSTAVMLITTDLRFTNANQVGNCKGKNILSQKQEDCNADV